MTIIQSIILGIVEGVTEFLPISSTGHLILVANILGVTDAAFAKSFEIIIQLGAILAVVVLYWRKLVYGGADQWKKILVAFLPTAVVGFLLYKILKNILLANVAIVVWSLAVGGVILLVFEWWMKKRQEIVPLSAPVEMTYKKAFFIGLIQCFSIIPGVSRAGATIVGGMMLGLSRENIVEFSFLLAIPTMAAATGYDLLKNAGSFSFNQFYVLAIGFVVSFIVAIFAIKWLLHFVKNHTFVGFGIYRIFIALLFWLFVVR